ncbi:MAG: hypothetical protein WC455_21315 [Dehalococcoidia bacterium]|jgi:hypothetical protein
METQDTQAKREMTNIEIAQNLIDKARMWHAALLNKHYEKMADKDANAIAVDAKLHMMADVYLSVLDALDNLNKACAGDIDKNGGVALAQIACELLDLLMFIKTQGRRGGRAEASNSLEMLLSMIEKAGAKCQ